MRSIPGRLMLISIAVIALGCRPPGGTMPEVPPIPPIPGRWSITCGGERPDTPSCIHRTSDRGYVVAGSTTSYWVGGSDAWVFKLAQDGTVEWQKSYGSVLNDAWKDIRQTGDGGYIVAGNSGRRPNFSYTYDDIWVVKLSGDGTIEWQKRYSRSAYSCKAESICPTPDGGYIVCGNTGYFSAWLPIVLKLSSDGDIQWQKTYDPFYDGHFYSVETTSDGGYILSGRTDNTPGKSYEAWLMKLNADGSIEWKATYGGDGDDRIYKVLEKESGGYVAAGRFGTGGGWILNLEADGAIIWQKHFGSHSQDEIIAIVEEGDGFAAGGNIYNADGTDLWIMKISGDGDILSQGAYGFRYAETAYGMDIADNSGFVIAGTLSSSYAGIDEHSSETWVVNVPGDCLLPGAAFMMETAISGEDTSVTQHLMTLPFWLRDGTLEVSETSVLGLHTGGLVKYIYP